jgi:hypothetical protein
MLNKKVEVECYNYERCGNIIQRDASAVKKAKLSGSRLVCIECKLKANRERALERYNKLKNNKK